jgi:hypothetical protein
VDEIRVGNITIQRDNSNLVFSDSSKPRFSLTLDDTHLPDILDFLSGLSSNPADNRAGFRVPIKSLSKPTRSAFSVSLETVDGPIEAIGVDMSVTGIRLEHIVADIAIGESVFVNLKHRDKEARMKATVVRFDGSRICLHFPDTLDDGELNPPVSLMNVYRALELDWLQERMS